MERLGHADLGDDVNQDFWDALLKGLYFNTEDTRGLWWKVPAFLAGVIVVLGVLT